MRKLLTALVAAASISAAAIAVSSPADAYWRGGGWRGGGWHGGYWGPGLGFAAGAVIGGALAAPYYPYGYLPLRPGTLPSALRVAAGLERLRLGSRLRLTARV